MTSASPWICIGRWPPPGSTMRWSTRQVRLTSDGEQLLDRVRALLTEVEDIDQLFQASLGQVSGRLIVDAPSRIARRVIAPALLGLLRRHPRLQLILGSSDRALDLVQEGVECLPGDGSEQVFDVPSRVAVNTSMPVSWLYPHRRQRSRRLAVFHEWLEALMQPHLDKGSRSRIHACSSRPKPAPTRAACPPGLYSTLSPLHHFNPRPSRSVRGPQEGTPTQPTVPVSIPAAPEHAQSRNGDGCMPLAIAGGRDTGPVVPRAIDP